jgi:hypothetical protein
MSIDQEYIAEALSPETLNIKMPAETLLMIIHQHLLHFLIMMMQ